MSDKYEAMDLIERLLDRMKLINGDDDKCVKGQNWGACDNHALIREAEDFLRKQRRSVGL